jgi:hypothetical protein
MPSHLIAPHVQAFFAEYLCQHWCQDTFSKVASHLSFT